MKHALMYFSCLSHWSNVSTHWTATTTPSSFNAKQIIILLLFYLTKQKLCTLKSLLCSNVILQRFSVISLI